LNAAERFCAPRDDQARVAKTSFPQEDGSGALHDSLLARIFRIREVDQVVACSIHAPERPVACNSFWASDP